MPTSSLSRRPGTRQGASVLAALAVTGTALFAAPAAVAAPGDNGDVKVHDSGTTVDNQRDDPTVCQFYLDGFDFDRAQDVSWSIETQPHVAGGATLAGGLIIPESGHGRTEGLFLLPKGQYKLTWNFEGESGAGKQKVFRVDCTTPTPTPTQTPPGGGPGGPNGGPPAGGGGLARTQDFSPVAGAAAAGLVVAGGVVYLRLRRRPDGTA
jgi:hypothetical protein